MSARNCINGDAKALELGKREKRLGSALADAKLFVAIRAPGKYFSVALVLVLWLLLVVHW